MNQFYAHIHTLFFRFLSQLDGTDHRIEFPLLNSRTSISSVQSLSISSVAQSCLTLWTHEPHACQVSLSITNSWNIVKFMSIESVMPSNHLILCRPLLLLPSILPNIRDFSNESALHIRWPKYWSFRFNISLSNEHPGLISFRMDWLDILAVTTIQKHQFFGVQLSW